ncbi:MAG: glycosyltransferase [Planctomycetes bacterium]|nr:glycosyltransferase [Planctomycetota bacterium]
MRILTINYEYPPLGGGGGVIHQHIVEELSNRHEVVVLTSGCRDLPARETVGGVDVHRVNVLGRNAKSTASMRSMLSFFPASMRKGQALIDQFRPDIINAHFAVPTGPSSVLLARRNKIPHALCIHGGDIYDPSKRLSPHRIPGLRNVVRWVLRRTDRVLAQSENTAANARDIYGYQRPITIIPHGLKRPELPAFARAELGLPEDAFVMISVGRLVSRKANHQLIEMLARIDSAPAALVLLGEGPERQRLESLAQELNVRDRVFLPGFVSEQQKLEYLQAADVFASTTMHEGFGLMFVEAMFCGLPIVTYDHGGQSDFLEDGKTGFLVKLNDRKRFQECVNRLLRSEMLRDEYGRYNLELSQKFTVEQCAAQYLAVFEELLSSRDLAMGEAVC